MRDFIYWKTEKAIETRRIRKDAKRRLNWDREPQSSVLLCITPHSWYCFLLQQGLKWEVWWGPDQCIGSTYCSCLSLFATNKLQNSLLHFQERSQKQAQELSESFQPDRSNLAISCPPGRAAAVSQQQPYPATNHHHASTPHILYFPALSVLLRTYTVVICNVIFAAVCIKSHYLLLALHYHLHLL